ncbi:DUF6894 family protein [Bradyrhizobium sp.]|jgi:hypothetical protein|uniref:DUF6894 family protein n=1 Tax=Bradyrhizobium sp. TaxID=376 RepID=UPI003BB13564
MAQLYFQYTSLERELTDRHAAVVANPAEAHEAAALVVQSLISAPIAEDWRSWVLHVSDDSGAEIFTLPFASMLGKPH